MGERLNNTAGDALGGVDVVCLVLDATADVGRGDRWVAERVPKDAVVVLNKVDAASRAQVLAQLQRAGELGFDEYVPVSAMTGAGVDDLVETLVRRLPEGPHWYPDDVVRDSSEEVWVAELVREQLLAVLREELPHSIACRVVEHEGSRIRVEILVERDSQKGIVIGKGGVGAQGGGDGGAGAAAGGHLPRAGRQGGARLAAPTRGPSAASGTEALVPPAPVPGEQGAGHDDTQRSARARGSPPTRTGRSASQAA